MLVWDDGQNYEEIRALLPQDRRYRVLVTTRAKWGPPVQRLDLDVLPLDVALTLLRALVGDDRRIETEPEMAATLCEWVGRLPLGIELIGRHLAGRPNLNLAELLKRLEAQKLQAKVLQNVPEEMAYQRNLEAAFELSWQLLSPAAQQLGGLLSLFALAPVSREWVAASLPEWDLEALEEAEAELELWSLVSLAAGRYLLHTLMREFLAAKLPRELSAEAEALKRGMAQAMTTVAQTVPPTVTRSVLERVSVTIPHWQEGPKRSLPC